MRQSKAENHMQIVVLFVTKVTNKIVQSRYIKNRLIFLAKGVRMNKFLIIGIAALVVALGTFVVVAEPLAYMGTDAATCDNCHVMDAAYENWFHAPHEKVTECVDCHLPHDNLVNYWFEKGKTGLHDVYYFSTGQTPELIRAKPETKAIIQANCLRCHQDTVENIVMGAQPFERNCWDCHRSVAHGQRGISIVPRQEK
jgi:cytochrome c nitrite reductase small subunit